MEEFEPVVERFEYQGFGAGWPTAVLVSNGGSITDGTYRDRLYRIQIGADWLEVRNEHKRRIGWRCSRCGEVVDDVANGRTDYCPNCGAWMGETHGKTD
jgi:rubrerythrin